MRTAGMVLALVGGVLGIFGGFCTAAAGATAAGLGANVKPDDVAHLMLLGWASSIGSLVGGILGKVLKSKNASIAFSAVVLICGGLAFAASNFITGPIIALGGILLMVGAFQSKPA